jgi:hypothetical protein
MISLPWGEVVSIIGSARERNPAPFSDTLAKTFRRSRVERASRSRRQTSKVSPNARAAIAFPSWRRSVTAPEIFSANTRSAPAARSAERCASNGKREYQLPSLDLGQVQHFIDQAQKMPSVALYAIKHGAGLLRHLAVDAVQDELGIAKDGVERSA